MRENIDANWMNLIPVRILSRFVFQLLHQSDLSARLPRISFHHSDDFCSLPIFLKLRESGIDDPRRAEYLRHLEDWWVDGGSNSFDRHVLCRMLEAGREWGYSE